MSLVKDNGMEQEKEVSWLFFDIKEGNEQKKDRSGGLSTEILKIIIFLTNSEKTKRWRCTLRHGYGTCIMCEISGTICVFFRNTGDIQ